MQDWKIAGLLGAGLLCLSLVRPFLGCLTIWLKVNHKWSGNLAQLASAVVALIGFSVVIFQIQEGRQKSASEAFRAELADARRLYMTYSDATLRYPQLTIPNYNMLMSDHIEYLRYKNFVAHMIYAYDEILNVVTEEGIKSDIEEWSAAFRLDISDHLPYICQFPDDDLFFQQYRREMRLRLEEVRRDCGARAPLSEQISIPSQRSGLGDEIAK
jgi:hypothetical protein